MHCGLKRPQIEDTHRLTIAELKHLGFLSCAGRCTGTLTLSVRNKPVGSVGFEVRYNLKGDSYIRFRHTFDGLPMDYRHTIDVVACNYGGHRFYFRCRNTGKRVTALYSLDGYYASRHYHELAYQLCNEHRNRHELLHRSQNLSLKAGKLRERGHPGKANRVVYEAFRYRGLYFRVLERRPMKPGGLVERFGIFEETRTA